MRRRAFLGLDARGSIYPFSLFFFLKFLISPSTRSGRAGPLLSAPAESRQRQAQGSFTPLRIPGPKWGAGRPPLETPKSRCAIRIGRTPRRLRGWSFGAVGEGRERLRARHDCRTSTASFGGLRPLAPAFPKGKSPPVMRERAWYRVRNGFCGNAFASLPEAPAAQAARSSVTPLARIAAEGRASATAEGESQRGRSPLWPVFAYFLLARK